jgi:phenylacetate-CoA ligase
MLVVRGVNVYPSAVENIVRACDRVAEYRVEVRTERSMTELRVEIEPTRGSGDAIAVAKRLETALTNAFGLRIPVTLAQSELPRFEMKAQRWIKT